jgi:hypothetical protein
MSLKFKIVFFNLMIFLIIFDIIYLFVWILSIQMNPAKAVIVAGLAVLFTPWIKKAESQSDRKVIIMNFAFAWYNKYLKK